MTRTRALTAVIALALLAAWSLLGVGYHRLETACYEARHSVDSEPPAFSDPIGAALDIALWPLYLAADAVSGSDCMPRTVR